MNSIRFYPYYISIFLVLSCKEKNNNNSWSMYKADASSSSYSPIDQINKTNVSQLKAAWTYQYNDAKEGAYPGGSQCNPIIVDDIMYVASVQRTIFALDAATGKKIWSYDPFDGASGGGSFRGVTWWSNGDDKRILFTAGDHLFSLDALTGKPVATFGRNGKVSMNEGIRDDSSKISIKPTSPGIIYKDLIIIGNEVSELYGAQPGYIRAYNVVTGKLEWTFHTIPLPGEFGYDTWPPDAWKYAGGANCWGGMSVDEKRGMVFLGTGSPTYDFYGADRKGINLFGNCIIALDAATGKRKWHFQTIHHDLWDYDLPSPPNLVTIKKDGKSIDAVAQTSKVGFLYILDRETGEPLYPIEERAVPLSDVPGEHAWPTQPFVTKPAPYAKQFITPDELSDFTPEQHDSAVRYFKSLRYEGLFTPPSVKGTFVLPGTIGGSEWGGAAYDPSISVIYLKSNQSPEISKLLKIEDDNNKTPDVSGRELYMNNCAVCHKADLKGEEGMYPSLVSIKERLTENQVLTRIREGAGKMPPFKHILQGKEKAIVDFLFERNQRTQKDYDVDEMKRNMAIIKDTSAKKDTNDVYINTTAYAIMRNAKGQPFVKPPWATLNAIDLNTGEYLWTVPAGNNDELQKKGAPPTGATGSPGPIATKGGLVFLGGSRDKRFQAYDKDTGKVLWDIKLPGNATSTPCTFMSKGKQYIAVSVSGTKENPAGSVMAFALPN
jgi:quinoprotein glucose dehydrogenase